MKSKVSRKFGRTEGGVGPVWVIFLVESRGDLFGGDFLVQGMLVLSGDLFSGNVRCRGNSVGQRGPLVLSG